MMLFGQESKQLWRTPIRTLAICLALALITGMFAIAYGLKQAADQMRARVEAEYTTAGYIYSTPSTYMSTADLLAGAHLSSKNAFALALNRGAVESQVALHIDRHSRLMAYDPDLQGVISEIPALNHPNHVAVFAVTCEEMLVARTAAENSYQVVNGQRVQKQSSVNIYYYNFRVEQAIALHEDFEVPLRLTVETKLYNIDLTASALEIGKTYLIWGFYEDLGDGTGSLTTVKENAARSEILKDQWESDRLLYCYLPWSTTYPTHRLPFLAEYSGSPEDYLRRDTSGMWEKLMSIAEISHSSVQIYSADHPYALPPFMATYAELSEGAFFSEAELEAGAKVAMISDIYAEKNSIGVGDTLDLSFYRSEYSNFKNYKWIYVNDKALMPTEIWGQNETDDPTYREKTKSTLQPASVENDTYTVVGIYSVDGWMNRVDYLHPNTVIIPQSSLSQVYALNIPQFDYTFILPNGEIDAFEEELTAQGYGGLTHYFDQGYETVIPGVETICHSAAFVYDTVRVMWVLAVVMILLIFTWMQMPTGKVKYRLGTGKRRIWAQMSFSALLVMLLSCVGGLAGSILLYDRAIEWTMQADFTNFNATFSTMSVNADVLPELLGMLAQTPVLFVKVCAVQFGVLLVLAAVFAAAAALRKKSFHQ